MDRTFDKIDLLAALGLFAGIAAWAFLWAHPYPHPDLWPFLVAVQGKVSATALGVAGRLALGVFAAFVYLDLRGFWFVYRDRLDELPDNFLYNRAASICGAAIFALTPYAWRAAQFLSPEFAMLCVVACAFALWSRGRGGKGLLAYSLSYMLLGLVLGVNPLGGAPFAYVAVSDTILRWKDGLAHGQREDDDFARRKKLIEQAFSVAAFVIGVILGGLGLLAFLTLDSSVTGVWALLLTWWRGWGEGLHRSILSPSLLALVICVVLGVMGLAAGRRIRAVGKHGVIMCRTLAALLAVATVLMLLRSVDSSERIRLVQIRDYVKMVADDAEGVRWLFTDGRFDDALRLEFAARKADTAVLNTMTAPTVRESERLRELAPEIGDRPIFAASGAEVFRMWARERPDRLKESAWQLGGNVVQRYGKVAQRTCGSVLRAEDADTSGRSKEADRRFAEWTAGILALAKDGEGLILGGVDRVVGAKFDALLWRAARMTDTRASRDSSEKKSAAADEKRKLVRSLDEHNVTLRAQGRVVERMLRTENLVLTSRESLEVALKRADFELARRYANEVLAGAPDDGAANFALGMANLEAKEYFRASVCFEKALRRNPNEPAALNNIAIAYMKLGQGEKALDFAERAAKVHPKSAEIQRTLAEIRKNVSKE